MNYRPERRLSLIRRAAPFIFPPSMVALRETLLFKLCRLPYRYGIMAMRSLGMFIAAGLSYFSRHRNHILERHEGARRLEGAKRVAIFVHYDAEGAVAGFVLHYLQALHRAGFEIVFVSNAPCIPQESWEKLRPLCAVMIRRRNRGYDFGAYKDGLGLVGDPGALDELVMANDSVYGPLNDLGAILASCDPAAASVWGMTDSWDTRYHLQSYFLLFKNPALKAPAFASFWGQVRYVPSKLWVIRRYELRLTQALAAGGLRCRALFPCRRAADAFLEAVRGGLLERADLDERQRRYLAELTAIIRRGAPLNPTHYLWNTLITDLGYPFVKRDLLRRNPMRIPSVPQWQAVIRGSSAYDLDLILRHLRAGA